MMEMALERRNTFVSIVERRKSSGGSSAFQNVRRCGQYQENLVHPFVAYHMDLRHSLTLNGCCIVNQDQDCLDAHITTELQKEGDQKEIFPGKKIFRKRKKSDSRD